MTITSTVTARGGGGGGCLRIQGPRAVDIPIRPLDRVVMTIVARVNAGPLLLSLLILCKGRAAASSLLCACEPARTIHSTARFRGWCRR